MEEKELTAEFLPEKYCFFTISSKHKIVSLPVGIHKIIKFVQETKKCFPYESRPF